MDWAVDKSYPHSPPAELAVVGWMFLHRSERSRVTRVLVIDDFVVPHHRALFRTLSAATEPLDQVELATRADVPLDVVRASVTEAPTFIASAIRVIAGTAMRRRVLYAADECSTMARDFSHEDGEVLDVARRLFELVDLPGEAPALPPTIAEFTAGDDVEPDWLVPQVLERGDRVMVTAAEGVGKSLFQRQFAVCSSAGLHPFEFSRIEPLRALVIDLESGEALVRRWMRRLYATAQKIDGYDPARCRVVSRPGGCDLTKRADRGWLAGLVEAVAPDLVCIGPLYKCYVADMREEESARVVAAFIDDLRERHSCAWLIETHAPHGESGGRRPLRPFGSSLWLRWPELGIGFRVAEDATSIELEQWRRPRDVRVWPAGFRRGDVWPWMPRTESRGAA